MFYLNDNSVYTAVHPHTNIARTQQKRAKSVSKNIFNIYECVEQQKPVKQNK